MTADIRLAPNQVEREDWPDGSILLHNRAPLPEPLPDILDRFDHWVALDDDAAFISERANGTIRTISYGAMDQRSDALAEDLAAHGLAKGDRIAVIDGAGVLQAALKLACLKAGMVHVPLSPLLLTSEHGRNRLAGLLAAAGPRLTVVPAQTLPEELAACCGIVVDSAELPDDEVPERPFSRPVASPDDPAAIYFTSGSTGDPKGVTITRRMIASCQGAYGVHWPFLAARRPALIDWLPWHHVFGGLDNFHKMIWYGGTYHVELPPGPDNMDALAARIREVRPTIHINVPYGIDLLLDHLADDADTRAALFARLDLIFFAGAGMGAQTWQRLQDAVTAGPHGPGGPPLVLSGYGATEAGSTMCLGHEPAGQTDEIGLPLPGHSLRLAPVDGAVEVRFRGPNVSPGYVGSEGLKMLSLDDAEFLRTGDLARALHDDKPEGGLCFDGRLAEDFKLTTGTRVKVGALRHAILAACAPDVQDVAIAGAGKDRIATILFSTETAMEDKNSDLQARMVQALRAHNAAMPGSSTSVFRAAIADGPPDRVAGEINDKGHLVQKTCLKNRADLVARLYGDPPGPDIICPENNASR
ncbi:MAG: AMP-binding protein [Alphaproteobacteria bacterium]